MLLLFEFATLARDHILEIFVCRCKLKLLEYRFQIWQFTESEKTKRDHITIFCILGSPLSLMSRGNRNYRKKHSRLVKATQKEPIFWLKTTTYPESKRT